MNEFEIGHNESMTLIQAALNESNSSVMIADNAWVVEGGIATMIQHFDATEQYIQQLLSLSTKGIMVKVQTVFPR